MKKVLLFSLIGVLVLSSFAFAVKPEEKIIYKDDEISIYANYSGNGRIVYIKILIPKTRKFKEIFIEPHMENISITTSK